MTEQYFDDLLSSQAIAREMETGGNVSESKPVADLSKTAIVVESSANHSFRRTPYHRSLGPFAYPHTFSNNIEISNASHEPTSRTRSISSQGGGAQVISVMALTDILQSQWFMTTLLPTSTIISSNGSPEDHEMRFDHRMPYAQLPCFPYAKHSGNQNTG